MRILYIPFELDEVGDLLKPLQKWQKRSRSTNYIILTHKSNINIEKLGNNFEVFICAHGNYDEKDFVIENKASDGRQLMIADLASRFDHDFIFSSHKIKQVNLYFCGTEEKNSQIAQIFRKNLIRGTEYNICYYHGNITIPDRMGLKWSKSIDKKVPIEQTGKMLFADDEIILEHEKKYLIYKETKFHILFENNKKTRNEKITMCRKINHTTLSGSNMGYK
ncbi:MAG: hypothetical protein HYX60_07640 [Legionella longbeachae]|nr:hypothetical protein [Legionella longbeachae]